MKKMELASPEAYAKMSTLNPKVWSKAFFETHSKTDSTENNMSECFNSWILRARYILSFNVMYAEDYICY